MEFGVLIGTEEFEFKHVAELGIPTIQMYLRCKDDELTEEHAEHIRKCCKKYNIRISAAWCRWPGACSWSVYEGQLTAGFVPIATRNERIQAVKKGADFCKNLGITDIITHAGFLPENPMTTEYMSIVTDLRDLANYLKNNDQYFLFETGQETPLTLRRMIEDVGTGNLGINLDPANLLKLGKGNPVDAVDIFGKYVRNMHLKDGALPVDGVGRKNGPEFPVGKGKVDFRGVLSKLKNDHGYDGPLTFEREIEDWEQKKADIAAGREHIQGIWDSI